MQHQVTTKRSWFRLTIKTLLWVLATLALALAIAYWTAPSWVPSQVQKFLPASIKLQNLEFKRPGLTSTQIDRLSLTLGEDTQYTLVFNQVDLGYSLWHRKITSISAEKTLIQWPQNSSSKDTTVLQQIPLPTLPVPEITIEELTLEGLTLQNIFAKNIVLRDSDNTATINTDISFLDKVFTIEARASRHNQQLSAIEAEVKQGDNTLAIQATPATSSHWNFTSEAKISPDDLYSEPGIEPLDLSLSGAVDFSQDIKLTLTNTSRVSTQIDAEQLGLISALQHVLKQNHITSNVGTFNPSYQLALLPLDTTVITYTSTKNQLTITEGEFGIQANNPAITLEAILSKLDLDLNQELTANMQQASAQINLEVQDLSGEFQSAEHQASSKSINLSAQTTVTLNQSALAIDNTKAQVKLAPVGYQGNNSKATITESSWSATGTSYINFQQDIPSTHQWNIRSQQPMNSTLSLDEEQFMANGISAQLSFQQTPNSPTGLVTGSYQSSEVSLAQQPLRLSTLKGSLVYPVSKTPKGQLRFENARYNNQQIGVSNISGELDWNKSINSFTAQGSLHHQQSKIPFTYEFNLINSRHNLKVKQSSLPVSTVTSWLNILTNYPQLSFNSGQLEIDSLDGDPIGLLFDGKIKLDNFNLNYEEFYVKNWTIEDSLTSSSKLGGTLKSHIESIELATDIAITDVSFLMPHTINSLVITNLQGKLLQGSIEIPQLTVNESGVSPFTAYLKAININTLLTALNSETLKLTGRFDFTLPLTINKQGQQITNGQFKALSEGVIQLKSDKGKDANIAFQALEDFHYKEFSGNINYNAKGDYTIEVNVLGSNPSLYNGFPIKLDLTLRGHLPEMLYSMIISGDMTKPILDDLQQRKILNIQQ